MKKEDRETVCDVLQLLEREILVSAIRSYLEGRTSEFWSAIESIDKFLSVEEKTCVVR